MNRRWLIIGGVAGVILLSIAAAAWLTSSPKPVTQTPEPAPSSSASPTPVLEPDINSEAQAQASKKSEIDSNPILARLPYNNRFWSLEWDGSDGDKYRLKATVYYVGGENPDEKVNQQRPYIEQFVKSTGQSDGTYVIEYAKQEVNSDELS